MAAKRKSKIRAVKATKKVTRAKAVAKRKSALQGQSFRSGYSKERILSYLASARVKRVLNITKTVLFVLVVGLAAVSLLSTLPIRTPIKPFVVLSGSMRPTIYEGSVAFVNRGSEGLKTGDIITFIRPDDFTQNVTHRIVSQEFVDGKAVYKTQGDANNTVDAWVVRPEAVWGKVSFAIPLLGYAVNFAKTRVGVILLVVIPLALIAIDELRIIRRELQKIRKGKKSRGKINTKAVLALIIYLIPVISSNVQTTMASWTENANVSGNQAETGFWVPPVVTVLTPAGGEILYHQNLFNITWTATPGCDVGCDITDITISYSVEGGAFTQIATGEANDGVYSWIVPDGVFSTNVIIQVTATDLHLLAGSDVSSPFTIKSPIVINEFYVNPQGDQWIEVKNLGAVNIDMTGWSYVRGNQTLVVSAANSDNDTAPGGSTIVTPGGYLLTTFSSGFQLPPGGPHTFSLLYNPGGVLVDSATFTTPIPAISERSFARCPDGVGDFQVTTTLTPLSQNQCTTALQVVLTQTEEVVVVGTTPSPEPTSTPFPTQISEPSLSPSPSPTMETILEASTSASPSPIEVPLESVTPTLTPTTEPTLEPAPSPNAIDMILPAQQVQLNV